MGQEAGAQMSQTAVESGKFELGDSASGIEQRDPSCIVTFIVQ